MSNEDILKQSVIDLARQQVDDGCHYLWGGAGNRPGESDGAWYRTSHVKLHENLPDLDAPALAKRYPASPAVPMIFAAWVNSSDKGKLVCAGRCALDSVGTKDLALDMEVRPALALKLKNVTDAQFQEFKDHKTTADDYRWPRPNGSLDAPTSVWGENCTGVRHFDCIGLVNYCFSTALRVKWQFGIGNFTDPVSARKIGFREVTPISSAQSCDIVTVGSEHIGIVTNLNTVIEAMDSAHGVLERPLTAGHWSQCWRLPASTWNVEVERTFAAGRNVPFYD